MGDQNNIPQNHCVDPLTHYYSHYSLVAREVAREINTYLRRFRRRCSAAHLTLGDRLSLGPAASPAALQHRRQSFAQETATHRPERVPFGVRGSDKNRFREIGGRREPGQLCHPALKSAPEFLIPRSPAVTDAGVVLPEQLLGHVVDEHDVGPRATGIPVFPVRETKVVRA